MKACCSRCGCAELPRPSSVVTFALPTLPTGYTHERVAWPLTRTVQAPHCARPHPKRGPRNPRPSRNAYRRGMPRSSISRSAALPFTLSVSFMKRYGGPCVHREVDVLNLATHALHNRFVVVTT